MWWEFPPQCDKNKICNTIIIINSKMEEESEKLERVVIGKRIVERRGSRLKLANETG